MKAFLAIVIFSLQALVAGAQEIDLGTDAQREAGLLLYGKMCAHCHGENGDGLGPATPYLRPTPRDFTSAMFKFRATETGELPRDEDIKQSIRNGMPYTSMPAWSSLSDDEISNLTYHIKTFSEDFVRFGDVVSVELPEPPDITDESIARGREVYLENQCSDCHGNQGRGDGISAPTLKDQWGYPIRAADMTKRWTYRGGSTRRDIYRTFTTGMDGTPMPAYSIQPPEDQWHLVDYVYSLSRETPDYGTVVTAQSITDNPGVALDPVTFAGAEPTLFPLVGQVTEPGRAFFPAVNAIEVRAVVSERHVALMLSWNDMSAQTTGRNAPDIRVPSWLNDTDTTRIFSDAVAVQFPTTLPPGASKPFFLFGDRSLSTDIWFADLASPNGAHFVGRGFRDLTAEGPNLDLSSEFEEGRWTVILRRARTEENHISFEERGFVPVAFSIWDGFSRERGNRRGVTSWYYIYVDPVEKASPVFPMLAYGLITMIVALVTTVVLQRKYAVDESVGYVSRGREYVLFKLSIARKMREIIRQEGLDEAIRKYRTLRAEKPEIFDFEAIQLNQLGEYYLRRGEGEVAIAVLNLNAEAHPDDYSIFDRLGRAFLQIGSRREAIENYEISVALNPNNADSLEILVHLNNNTPLD